MAEPPGVGETVLSLIGKPAAAWALAKLHVATRALPAQC